MRIVALAVAIAGCAHAPSVEAVRTDVAVAGDSIRVIRAAVRDELIAASFRPNSQLGMEHRLNGVPVYLGTIDFTATSKTNAQATTPFSDSGELLCGKVVLLQASQAVYVLPVTTSTGTVTATNGVELQAKERVVVTFETNAASSPSGLRCFIAALRVSSNGDLKAWDLQ